MFIVDRSIVSHLKKMWWSTLSPSGMGHTILLYRYLPFLENQASPVDRIEHITAFRTHELRHTDREPGEGRRANGRRAEEGMTRRQHSLRKTLVKQPSVLTHDAVAGTFGISAREILHMNEDGLSDHNMVCTTVVPCTSEWCIVASVCLCLRTQCASGVIKYLAKWSTRVYCNPEEGTVCRLLRIICCPGLRVLRVLSAFSEQISQRSGNSL